MKHMLRSFIVFVFTIVGICSCSGGEEEFNDDKISLYGVIFDSDSGTPVPNVMVRLYEGSGAMASLGGVVSSSVTGSDGGFYFVGIKPYWRYTIITSHPDYENLMQDVELQSNSNTQISLSITRK